MNPKEQRMLLKNLVVLMYSDSGCCHKLTDKAIPGLTIDLENEQWSYRRPAGEFPTGATTRKIGEYNHSMKFCSRGVIGVYDKNNIQHLNAMLRHWQEIKSEDREP